VEKESLKDDEVDFNDIKQWLKYKKPAGQVFRNVMLSKKTDLCYTQRERPSSLSMAPLLKRIGWNIVDGKFVHELMSPMVPLDTLHDVRVFMCNSVLENATNIYAGISEKERLSLHRWAVSVNLEKFWHLLRNSEVGVLKQDKASTLLTRLGFGMIDGKFSAPYSDRNRAGRDLLSLKQLYVDFGAPVFGAASKPLKKLLALIGTNTEV